MIFKLLHISPLCGRTLPFSLSYHFHLKPENEEEEKERK